jgi:hypothetical protein
MKTALAILLLAFSLATGNLFAQATFPNQSNGLTSGPSTARLYIPESLANAPAEVQATVASRAISGQQSRFSVCAQAAKRLGFWLSPIRANHGGSESLVIGVAATEWGNRLRFI